MQPWHKPMKTAVKERSSTRTLELRSRPKLTGVESGVKGQDERQSTAPLTPLSTPTLPYALDKANVVRDVNTSTINSATGAGYASFLIGAVDGGGISDSRAVITTGACYYTFSPFVQDDFQVTQKLTLNLGLRWDIYSPFHEIQNRLSFVNATLTNPVTGSLGALSFAGNGTFGCNCSTSVQT
jgi:TonB dependent receptor